MEETSEEEDAGYTGYLRLEMHKRVSALFRKQELVPAIVQEASTGKVLMLAYMNEASQKNDRDRLYMVL